MNKQNNNEQLVKALPGLGLIFGVPIGALFGIIINQEMMPVYAGFGAAIGLIIGAIIYSYIVKKNK